MRLRDSIRFAACACWVGVLGAGTYLAWEADSSSRAGVIRAGMVGGTQPAILSGQDPQARSRTGMPHNGESVGANPRSPGFASYPSSTANPLTEAVPGRANVAVSMASLVDSSRGVRHVPAPESTLLELERNPVPGSYLPYEVTAYSHGCTLPRIGPERPPQRAANGRWPVADLTVAADTRLHPFGTELLVEGLGFRTVGDRGHAIKGRRLDLFVDSCREAVRFGRRWLKVHLVPAATSLQAAQ